MQELIQINLSIKIKPNKEEKIRKENFFDKINKILFQKYFKIFFRY